MLNRVYLHLKQILTFVFVSNIHIKVPGGCWRWQQQQQCRCDCSAPTGMSQTEHGGQPPAWRFPLPDLTRQTPWSPGGSRADHRSLPWPGGLRSGCPGGGPFKPCVSMLGWTSQTHQQTLMDESAPSQIHTHTCHSLKQRSNKAAASLNLKFISVPSF